MKQSLTRLILLGRAKYAGAMILALTLIWQASLFAGPSPGFVIGTNDFLLNGSPFEVRCGEMHFARIPREYWAHRLRMAHAMGLNTICAYLFWNLHEPQPGKFNFSGNADVAEFCRLAQREGLKVILRPGPYSCAEWDFGGFPYWLLKIPDLQLRTQDPRYLDACKQYLLAVGRELAPLQITQGGPIIMVQVENEYGSYGSDREYIRTIRNDLTAAGFDVPLFTCDGPTQLKNDVLDNLFCVVNFGSDPAENFQALRAIRPTGPLMCGEYYPGWFDSWGAPHHLGDTTRVVDEIGWMLNHDASFSIYMVHGGTSFGFTAGANSPPFSPQVTSYDYDAPISEAGWDTPKYHALRTLFLQHLAPGESLPAIPKRPPVITLPPMELNEVAPLFDNLPPSRHDEQPKPMESYDQSQGCILYRTKIPPGDGETLVVEKLHDYGLIFLDGKNIGTLDRRHDQNSLTLPAHPGAATLDVLVDTFGHVNYGRDILDPKGITEKVELIKVEPGIRTTTNELSGWDVFNLPLDGREIRRLKFEKTATSLPAFYRTTFHLQQTGDTFLDLSSWGKGVAWINGHNLGRFWNIGPQQTLYCPAPWLRRGRNELIVLDFETGQKHAVTGLAAPVLNQLP